MTFESDSISTDDGDHSLQPAKTVFKKFPTVSPSLSKLAIFLVEICFQSVGQEELGHP